MMPRMAAGWQLILADLALILFLVTLAALAGTSERSAVMEQAVMTAASDAASAGAPVQALYRRAPDVDAFGVWLLDQPNDPRAQVTIYANFSDGGEARIWREARTMADDAQRAGLSAKVVIAPGTRDDIYASIAFDTPPQLQRRETADSAITPR